jgi:hypothetical protein
MTVAKVTGRWKARTPITQRTYMDINTIPEDVYNLFDPEIEHIVDETNLEEFAETLKEVLRSKLGRQEARSNPLRFSALGKPNRQVWFEAHPEPGTKEKLIPKTYLKFLYGDVIEALLVLLIKESGHEVTHQQAQVEVDGVIGHTDGLIDGVAMDIKSASPFGYKKFKDRTVTEDDPFGYVAQLSGYADVLTPGKDAAWIAMDKVSGDICVSPLSKMTIQHYKPADRIKELKEVINSESIPDLCHQPVPDGKSGNHKLPTACSYCSHKFRCHPSLRTFIYSTGPRFLTAVAKVPDVPEVKKEDLSLYE